MRYTHNAQKQVSEFDSKASAFGSLPETLTAPSLNVIRLRERLIDEEFQEFKDHNSDFISGKLSKEDYLVQVADDLADLLYVVYGAANAFGIDIGEVFEEVHRSNMTKFIDGHRREDGKWVKGPSYSPADIRKVLYGE